MELKLHEYINLSKYPLDIRRRMFPSLRLREADFCIVYLACYGYDTYHSGYYSDCVDMISALKIANYKERKAVNNLGRM